MTVDYFDIRRWTSIDAEELASAADKMIRTYEDAESDLRTAGQWNWSDSAGERGATDRLTNVADFLTDCAAEAARTRDIANDVVDWLEPLKLRVADADRTADARGFEIHADGQVSDLRPSTSFSLVDKREMDRLVLQEEAKSIITEGRRIEKYAAEGLAAVGAGEISDAGASTIDDAVAKEHRDFLTEYESGERDPARLDRAFSALSEEEKEELWRTHRDELLGLELPPATISDFVNRKILDEEILRLVVPNIPDQQTRNKLDDLLTLREALNQDPNNLYLLGLDTSRDRVEAIMASGNPDYAPNVGIITPGMNSTITKTMPGLIAQSQQMRQDATMVNDDEIENYSVVSYMGYQAPQNLGDAGLPVSARDGAPRLADFTDRIAATSDLKDPNITLYGHSYGSAVTGLAAQELYEDGTSPVDNIVLYGSPGFPRGDLFGPTEITEQTGVPAERSYYMENPGDIVDTNVLWSGFGPLSLLPETWGMTELNTATTEKHIPDPERPDKAFGVKDYNSYYGKDVSPHSAFSEYGTTALENMSIVLADRPELLHK